MTVIDSSPAVHMPPGPRWPAPMRALAFTVFRPRVIMSQAKRYGPAFSVKMPLWGPSVVITDPAMIKQVFRAPATDLEMAKPSLAVLFGRGSLFGLEGEDHLNDRKLLAPAFNGNRMRAYEALVEEETLREIATWADGHEFAVSPSTMRITLNVILRAIFGAEGDELAELREIVPGWVQFGQKLFALPLLRRDFGRWSPWARHLALRQRFDHLVSALIDKAQADPYFAERNDVLSIMLRARYNDGTAMSHKQIGDELMALLAAGHETTATSLAWAFERLRRHPAALARLVAGIDAGDEKVLQATIYETHRVRPVIDGIVRRVLAPTYSLGPWIVPQGCNIYISFPTTHFDPAAYQDPEKFEPLRFRDSSPDPSLWMPFGGGVRRCIGAAFANMEMKVVLRTVLSEYELLPTSAADEKVAFRGVAYAPDRGGLISVHRRRTTIEST